MTGADGTKAGGSGVAIVTLDSTGALATGSDTAAVSADTATGSFTTDLTTGSPGMLIKRPGSSFFRGTATGATAAAAATEAAGVAADFFLFSFASAMKILLV
jgi:hypothetical protein